MRYCRSGTRIFMNNEISPLYTERYADKAFADPVKQVQSSGLEVVSANYSRLAIVQFGDRKMANYLQMREVIKSSLLPFSMEEFHQAFCALTRTPLEKLTNHESL
jgi:hypothetical protein